MVTSLWHCCRYKQSQMEAKTLQLVKRELDHVDDLVTRDVSVLRDKIEDANRDYNLARYPVLIQWNPSIVDTLGTW